jgi:hypothetical protein
LRSDRENLTAKYGSHGEDSILEIYFQKNNGVGGVVFTEYKLATQKDFHPVYMTQYVKQGDVELQRDSIDNELGYNESGRIWFPKKVVYRRIAGGKLIEEEVDTISLAEFNNPIEDQKFTLAGMNISEGRLVDNEGKLMWWTGTNLTPKYVGQENYSGTTLVVGGNKYFLIINALVFAALAIAFIFLRLLPRKKT